MKNEPKVKDRFGKPERLFRKVVSDEPVTLRRDGGRLETNVSYQYRIYDRPWQYMFPLDHRTGNDDLYELAFNILVRFVAPADALELHRMFADMHLKAVLAPKFWDLKLPAHDILAWIKNAWDMLNAQDLEALSAEAEMVESLVAGKTPKPCEHPAKSVTTARAFVSGALIETRVCGACGTALTAENITLPKVVEEKIVEKVIEKHVPVMTGIDWASDARVPGWHAESLKKQPEQRQETNLDGDRKFKIER